MDGFQKSNFFHFLFVVSVATSSPLLTIENCVCLETHTSLFNMTGGGGQLDELLLLSRNSLF